MLIRCMHFWLVSRLCYVCNLRMHGTPIYYSNTSCHQKHSLWVKSRKTLSMHHVRYAN